MKTFRSVSVRILISAAFIIGITAASCNQRSGEVKIKEDREGNEDVHVRERMKNDSVDIKRDQVIESDEDGYGDTKVRDKTKIDMERDRNEGQGASESSTGSDRGTNQGNDHGDAGTERR